MSKHGKGPKKRKKIASITVGSGITEYSRPPSIFDPPYRDKALKGKAVDSRVRRSPAKPWDQFRREAEQFCREVFQSENLPNPFNFIHPEERFSPLEGWDVMSRDLDYIQNITIDLNYHLAADWHSPSENHTPLWYAAHLARGFTSLDLTLAQLRANSEPAEALIMKAVHIGRELGSLDSERRLKPAHEPDALRGKITISAASMGGLKRVAKKRKKYAAACAEMDCRIGAGETKMHAARQIIKKPEFGLTIQPSSFVRIYLRYRSSQK